MEEEQGIYREEVLVIMGVIADVRADVAYIRRFFERLDDEMEEDDEGGA